MKVTINEQEFELKYSFRALMMYEKIANKTFSNLAGLTEILIFFYSVILSSNMHSNITWDNFVDWLDENPSSITEFTQWLNSIMVKNNFITDNDTQKTESVKEGDVDPKKD